MPPPVVSVVVPTRGGATRLPVLLDALARQAIDEPWELVVVLDGDVDGSRAVVEAYADRLPLRILERTGGHGVAAALADGYAAAYGEIVLRCDDDLTPRAGLRRAPPRAAPGPTGRCAAAGRDRADPRRLRRHRLRRGLRPAGQRAPARGRLRPTGRRALAALGRLQLGAARRPTTRSAGSTRDGLPRGLRARPAARPLRRGDRHRPGARDRAPRAGAGRRQPRVARAFTSGASTRAFEARHPGHGQLRSRRRERVGPRRRGRGRPDPTRATTPPPRPSRRRAAAPRCRERARGKLVAWAVEAAAQAGRRTRRCDLACATSRRGRHRHRQRRDPAPRRPGPDPGAHRPARRPRPPRRGHRRRRRLTDPVPRHRRASRWSAATANGGFGANVNSGAAAATGDALLVLNSDLTIEPTFVADMVDAAAPVPAGAVLAPRMVDEHGHAAWVGRDFPRVRAPGRRVADPAGPLPRHRPRGTAPSVTTYTRTAREAEVDWVVGAAMWIPTAAFRAVGGFDERFFMNSEEVDLQRRLRDRGIPVHRPALARPSSTRAAARRRRRSRRRGSSSASCCTPTSGAHVARCRPLLARPARRELRGQRAPGGRPGATFARCRSARDELSMIAEATR